MSEAKEKLRIDKYLWSIRLFKTRSQAGDACSKGKVKCNGDSVKASRVVGIGDEYEVKTEAKKWLIKVTGLLPTRVQYVEAVNYYIDITPAEELDRIKFTAASFNTGKRLSKVGRPTKKSVEIWAILWNNFHHMIIDIITVVPDLLVSPFAHSIMKRAQDKGLLTVRTHNLRKWAVNKQAQVDDYPYGGGAGMVLMCEPLANAIEELKKETVYDAIIYLTPDGKTFNQKTANTLSLTQNLLIICGHYKGIDERIRQQYITQEISIGDYVLSGGEIAAAVMVDAIGRLLPGVLSDETSALTDSFQDNLLAPPVYTRPANFRGNKVPDILLQGDPKKVEEWRFEQSLERTKTRRPDLLED